MASHFDRDRDLLAEPRTTRRFLVPTLVIGALAIYAVLLLLLVERT